MIWIVPVTGEYFAKNRIEGFLHATTNFLSQRFPHFPCTARANVRWFDMPATQVKLDHRNKALSWIFDFRHRKEGLGVCHEATAYR